MNTEELVSCYFTDESEVLCKNENDWRRGLIVPEDDDYYPRKAPEDEQRADLITIHIYKDQIVKLTEDIIRWAFRKIKGAFRQRKKERQQNRKENAGQNKEKEET